MRTLTAAEVLSVWECSLGRPPLRQALDLLACAAPEQPWARLPFGQVCRGLFRLRSLLFGPVMPSVVCCPKCGEAMEFTFQCDAIEEAPAAPADLLQIEAGERRLAMRLPTAGDLLAVRTAAELLQRCAAAPVEPDSDLLQAASEGVAEADPLSETLLALVCAACGHAWQAALDIVSYLGREIAYEARRLLGDAHRLASVYGWSERDILAMSPARRRAYLEMAGV
jgi:hypothetical protein